MKERTEREEVDPFKDGKPTILGSMEKPHPVQLVQ